jgi:hypothetical protein
VIRHTVLINVRADAPPDATEKMVEAARTLPERIPAIRHWEVGRGLNPNNASVGIVALFDDLEAFSDYMAHPAHREVAQTYVVPVMESGIQVQFEI